MERTHTVQHKDKFTNVKATIHKRINIIYIKNRIKTKSAQTQNFKKIFNCIDKYKTHVSSTERTKTAIEVHFCHKDNHGKKQKVGSNGPKTQEFEIKQSLTQSARFNLILKIRVKLRSHTKSNDLQE